MTSRKHAVMGLAMVFLLTLFMGGAWAGQPVRIGYLQADIHQLSCWVAIEKGFYKEQGLDVEVAGIFKAGPEEMSAFAAGELDMGYVGEAPATTAVANGAAKVQVLAQVNTEGSAIMVGKDAAIAKVTQLAGKSVAVPGPFHGAGFSGAQGAGPEQGARGQGEDHGGQAAGDDRSPAHQADRRLHRLGALPGQGPDHGRGQGAHYLGQDMAGPSLLRAGG
jgi:hypothetical protein